MERLYYVESEQETAETSDRLEAARIAAEWTRRGYKVDTIAVDVTDGDVQIAEEPPERTPRRRTRASSVPA
jgi:hypothetical protein